MAFRGHALITDFSAGEISPRWLSRVQGGGKDPLQGGGSLASMYQSGCRDLTNMIVMPQGGVVKRPGTRFLRDIRADMPSDVPDDQLKMIVFEQPQQDYLVIVAGTHLYVYLMVDEQYSAPVADFLLPYDVSAVKDLQFAQLQDAMVLFHPSRRMRVLRLRQEKFTLTDAADEGFAAPLYDFRDDQSPPSVEKVVKVQFVLTVKVSREAWLSVSGIETPNEARVRRDDIQLTQDILLNRLRRNGAVVPGSAQVTYVGDGTSLEYEFRYRWSASVGSGTGELTFRERADWGDDEVLIEVNEEGAGGGEPLWSGPLYTERSSQGYICIAPHISEAANEPGVGAEWTTYWETHTKDPNTDYTEVEWEINRGYSTFNRGWPSTGTGHEQRLVANGGVEARGVVAGSRTGVARFLDFTTGPNDGDGFVFLLTATNGTAVTWLHSQKVLMVGTSAGLFVQLAFPLAPTNVNFSQQSAFTIAPIRGESVAGEVFYAQRNRRSIRQIQYVEELQSWQSTDLAAYAEHLFTPERGVADMTYHPTPDSLMWVVREDGALLALTYEKFYGVIAWHKHTIGDPVADVEVGFNGVTDEMVTLVNRTYWDDVTQEFTQRLMLEGMRVTSSNEFLVLMTPDGDDFTQLPAPPALWLPRLDSHELQQGTGSTTLTVPRRFYGRDVSVVEDGVNLGSYRVDPITGTIELPNPTVEGSAIHVGFSYKARVIPNRIEMAAGVTAQSQKIRWTRPKLRLFASVMPRLNGQLPNERDQDATYNTPPTLFTGDVSVSNLGTTGELVIEADEPLPFHMTGIFGLVSLEEG